VPVKPKFPAAAKKQTDEGAVAFVEYYWAALNYAWAKPDAEILADLGTPQCSVCDFFQKTADELKRKKQHVDAPSIEVNSAKLVYRTGTEAQVITEVSRTKASTVDQNGGVIRTNSPGSASRVFRLEWDRGWFVIELGEG